MITALILNKGNHAEIRQRAEKILADAEQDQIAYKTAFDLSYAEAEEKGTELPAFNPPPAPNVILSGELLCKHCGYKCGSLDFPVQKGVDAVLAELAGLDVNCGNH